MKIKQKKMFKPLVITLETAQEYNDFFSMVEEAINRKSTVFMKTDSADKLADLFSEYATNNVI